MNCSTTKYRRWALESLDIEDEQLLREGRKAQQWLEWLFKRAKKLRQLKNNRRR
jgi:hypothetical protein